MSGETTITVVGNLTADPELRFTAAGAAVANFTVASTPRTFDKATGEWKDGDALFLRCSVWRQPAENIAESLTKGSRVIVTGRLKQRSFETKEGEKRTVVELEVDEIGPSLRYATAKVNKVSRSSDGGDTGGDVWASAPPAAAGTFADASSFSIASVDEGDTPVSPSSTDNGALTALLGNRGEQARMRRKPAWDRSTGLACPC